MTTVSLLAADRQQVLFYTPESNINNYATLKTGFDAYFRPYGQYDIQPCRKYHTFYQLADQPTVRIFMVSHWIYSQLSTTTSLQPLFIGSRDGETEQRIFLFSKSTIRRAQSLSGCILASAADPRYTQAVIRQLFPSVDDAVLHSIDYLSVPKDIDAVMSIVFGMADAALTTQYSYHMFQKTNPQLLANITKCDISQTLPLPVVAVRGADSQTSTGITQAFTAMATTSAGKKLLRLFGFNEWKPYSP